jgi:hypothetical protein
MDLAVALEPACIRSKLRAGVVGWSAQARMRPLNSTCGIGLDFSAWPATRLLG